MIADRTAVEAETLGANFCGAEGELLLRACEKGSTVI